MSTIDDTTKARGYRAIAVEPSEPLPKISLLILVHCTVTCKENTIVESRESLVDWFFAWRLISDMLVFEKGGLHYSEYYQCFVLCLLFAWHSFSAWLAVLP